MPREIVLNKLIRVYNYIIISLYLCEMFYGTGKVCIVYIDLELFMTDSMIVCDYKSRWNNFKKKTFFPPLRITILRHRMSNLIDMRIVTFLLFYLCFYAQFLELFFCDVRFIHFINFKNILLFWRTILDTIIIVYRNIYFAFA